MLPKRITRSWKELVHPMRDNDKKTTIILSVIGIIPVVWLGLKIAPYVKGGLPEIVSGMVSDSCCSWIRKHVCSATRRPASPRMAALTPSPSAAAAITTGANPATAAVGETLLFP